ncbi:aminotransferase class III-fold pyridoxal phosphate-dependent enzyme [Staphylococcus caprae]|uniref:aminotransferase class III-fold pyridoxal phosphate-dependent enzyme n=1 Tax=Staphylococcus caprae TaxID=29380 RepID=UPI0024B48438|nr:aminotransferase class III-fold pyridoxal phosphate-dependent enzyme [Staphylococcus caprae]MDI9232118.1 aminotransferase class III-fold pyridoxal phosphate-dependent enzyme [Staphylococcus caprae]
MSNKHGFLNGYLRNDTLHNISLLSGSGSKLLDANNKRYIDLNSGLWNVVLGYNEELNQNFKYAFSKILDNNLSYIDMTSYHHELYEEVAEMIIDFIGKDELQKVVYTNSGSESIEGAIKIVNSISNKNKIVSFSNSYHGTFFGDMSVSGLTKEVNKEQGIDYSNRVIVDFPKNSLDEEKLFDYIKNNKNEISAFFIEPVIGSGGIHFRGLDFYEKLLKICNRLDIITIFDEVATGFYKSGEKFFINKLSTTPDVLCVSKSINNGVLPSGAIILNEKIINQLKSKTIKHMSTQNGNILAIVSIKETLKYYNKYNNILLENVKQIEKVTKDICDLHNIENRSIGTMIAIPVKKDNINPLIEALKNNGILVYRHITKTGNGLTLFPHININIDEYKKVLKFIIKRVKKYEIS